MAVNETMGSWKEIGGDMGAVLSLPPPLSLSDESTGLCVTLRRLPKRRKSLSSSLSPLLFFVF